MNPELSTSLLANLDGSPPEDGVCDRKPRQQQHMDRGWAWIILAASFVIHIILFALVSGIGMFYSEFLDEFGRGPVATSWLIATHMALTTIAGPIGSILANRFGFRPVIIGGSLVTSLGFASTFFIYDFWALFFAFVIIGAGWGVTYAPSFGILSLYFDKRKTFATAFCMVAIGIGTFVMPPVQGLLTGYMAWRGTCLIFGGIGLNMIPCAMFFVDKHTPPQSSPRSLSDSADLSLFKKSSFYIILINFFLSGSLSIFNISGLRFAITERGVQREDALLLISGQGVLGVFGRLTAVGIGLSRWKSSEGVRFGIFHVTTVLFALSIVLYAVMPSYAGLMIFGATGGYFFGVRASLLPGLLIEIFSARRFSTAFAYGLCMFGIGTLVFPPLGEWIAVLTNRTEAPFYLNGTCLLLACTCTLVLQFCPKSKGRQLRPVQPSKCNNT